MVFIKDTMEIPVPGDTKGTILGTMEIPDNDITRICIKKDMLSSVKIYLIMREFFPAIDKCSSNEIGGMLGMNPTSIRKIRRQIRAAVQEFDQEKKARLCP